MDRKNKANEQHVRVGTDASGLDRSPQQSVLPFSSELWILSRVFLMRRAVSRADGFWYQHSFMSFTRADRV